MDDGREDALLRLGRWLRARGYRFVTVTPETHRRVNARREAALARDLRDVFGWSRPFRAELLDAEPLALLRAAEAVVECDGLLTSRVRWSSLDDALVVHSAYPTLAEDAVFFGPDTYRFAALARARVATARRVVDIGCGGGAGGLAIADRCARVTLADINPTALSYARINATLAGVAVETVRSDVLRDVAGAIDLVIANPPYLSDDRHRAYRDGGGALGTDLSVRIVAESLARLEPGGRLIVYTGSPILAGVDRFAAAVLPLVAARGGRAHYRELDPDVFGEELDRPAYARCERIAVVALEVDLPP